MPKNLLVGNAFISRIRKTDFFWCCKCVVNVQGLYVGFVPILILLVCVYICLKGSVSVGHSN